MSVPTPIKIGEWLYRYAYAVYKPMYFQYKKQREKTEIALIKKIITPGDIIVDIGANIGFYTQLFSALTGKDGRVFAFEPDRSNFEKLKKNTKHLSNVVLENKAVSAQSGKITLYHSTLNVDHRTYPSDGLSKSHDVECVALDDYFSRSPTIHLIKIDIQGYEPIAFKGMLHIVQQNKHIKLLSEFWPYGLEKAGYSPWDYWNMLKNEFPHIYLIEEKNILKDINESFLKTLKKDETIYYNLYCCKQNPQFS